MTLMPRPIFELQGARAGEPMQIPFGPWLVWGQPQVSYVNVREQPENRGEVFYQAWVRLARSPFGNPTPMDITNPGNFSNGDTGLVLPKGMDVALGFNDNAPALELKTDEQRHVTHLSLPRINAPSIEVALTGVNKMASTVVWALTSTTNTPVFYDAILVRSMDSLQFRAQINGRSPDVGIAEPDPVFFQSSLRPFVSQYVEGVRSSSPFYSFLCFFKICYRVNDVRQRFRKLCERQAVEPPALNGVFPEDPLAHVSTDVVGQKYTVVINRYQELYRNSIAHFGQNERLEPLVRLEEDVAVRAAALVMRWAAFDLINQMAAAVQALVAAGMDLQAIEFG